MLCFVSESTDESEADKIHCLNNSVSSGTYSDYSPSQASSGSSNAHVKMGSLQTTAKEAVNNSLWGNRCDIFPDTASASLLSSLGPQSDLGRAFGLKKKKSMFFIPQSWPPSVFHNPTAGGSALCHPQALKLLEVELQLVLLVSHYCCPSSLHPWTSKKVLGKPGPALETFQDQPVLSVPALNPLTLFHPRLCSIKELDENRQKLPVASPVKKQGGNLLSHSSIIFTAGKCVQRDFWEHSEEPARPLSDFLASPCVS